MKYFAKWIATGTSPDKYRAKIYYEGWKRKIKFATIESISEHYTSEEFETILKELDAKCYRNKRVSFSGIVSVQDASKWSGLWIKACDESGNTLKLDTMYDRPVVGTVSKKPCSCIMDIPYDAEKIYIGFLLCGSGYAKVENIEFQVIEHKE